MGIVRGGPTGDGRWQAAAWVLPGAGVGRWANAYGP